ncbi:MAG: bifunctional diaminohydroxyphosphoribosylaminopyrimidine deaminase/5-amino-6-(5-phosphoribosylamino)uracil reductase RibD [Candidatus Binataceae bacterium]
MARRNDPQTDRRFMAEALALAAKMLGLTSPNPTVGCVIVRNGRIVGRGATARGGRPHAETRALAAAGSRTRGATAYVTLEPCAHYGATPPCADALVRARVTRVVVGCLDPYPPVRGRGIAILRRAHIAVTTGVLASECRRLNEAFITRQTRRRPFVILKLATSLDGRIAAASGDSRWISSDDSRRLVHRWRRECDAVLVGAGTVIADDPRLTCRSPGGRDPVRIVVDARLRVPPDARIFRQRSRAPTILVTVPSRLAAARRRYQRPRVEIIAAPADREGIALDALMRDLARRGISRLLIEGGARVASSALRARIVDRVALFVAPLIIGSGLPAVDGLAFRRVRDAISLSDMTAQSIGRDWLFAGRPIYRRLRSRRS